jgi:hypothetical protein
MLKNTPSGKLTEDVQLHGSSRWLHWEARALPPGFLLSPLDISFGEHQ